MSMGFHAKNDTWAVRNPMFALLGSQAPRVDTTFLLKSGAHEDVRSGGDLRLYTLAWLIHLRRLCDQVVRPDDHLYVVVGTVGTRARRAAAESAVRDVVSRMRQQITLCVWPASTAWGLQVADYALWAVHRHLVGHPLANYESDVAPLVRSIHTPWGEA